MSRDPDEPEVPCYHGGAFWEAIGDDFAALRLSRGVVNADVLDAWFPPASRVLEALRAHLPWLVRTSPPTACEGLVRAIARARSVDPQAIVVGGGSSALIFLAFRLWLTPSSRALILDPTYGEYTHVLERVIGCVVDRLELHREDGYRVEPARLAERIARGVYDLVALVNPNSPTGGYVAGGELIEVLRRVPARTRVWVDETYVEYAGPGVSVERFAAGSENVLVCKSMSKVYALSGLRVAYLCGAPALVRQVRSVTPPWAVGLLAQVAAVAALREPDYYTRRYRQTRALRRRLETELRALSRVEIILGTGPALFCHLPEGGPDAASVCAVARREGVFLRDASSMGAGLGRHALRIAVKGQAGNRRIVQAITHALGAREPRDMGIPGY
jgi:histidinol-phosphate/aromatic aminotransferase/cobyric acid decarboxylase-like protein